MRTFLLMVRRRIPTAGWVALAVVGAVAALLWWDPIKERISTRPEEQPLAWPEVEAAPLTGPDRDPLPPGALVRLGREGLRQGGGRALLAFSPDGKILASLEPPRLDWHGKHTIHLWEAATGKEVRRLESPGQLSISNILFSADGKRLSLLGNQFCREGNRFGNWMFCILDVDTGKEVRQLKGPWEPSENPQVVVSPDGKMLAWAVRDKATIRLWDLPTGQEVRQLARRPDEQPAGFTADGKALICMSYQNKAVRFCNVTTGADVQQVPLSPRAFRTTFSADGKEMLAWEYNGPIRCWDVIAEREVRQLDNPYPGSTLAVALSPDGRTAAGGYSDGKIRCWDVATGKQSREIHAHPNQITVLSFSGDGKVLASKEWWDGAIQLWDVATGDKLSPHEGHQAGIASLSVAPDGKTVATVGEDRTLRLWDLSTGQELRRFPTTGLAVAFSPDGKILASTGKWESADRRGSVWLLDASTGRKLRTFAGGHVYPYRTLAFSPDGTRLVGCGSDEDSCLWEVASGKVLRGFPGRDFQSAVFSPDGSILAAADGAIIELWDQKRDESLRRFGPASRPWTPSRGFASLVLSPDGKLLAAADGVAPRDLHPPPQDGVIRIYEVATGQERLVLQGYRGLVTSIQFSPDGKTLVSGGEDGTVRLWEVGSGKELRRFEGHRDRVTCVAFAPDGRTVISSSGDSTALVWDVTPPRP